MMMKDGVKNNFDKCPNTSPGVKVNKDGCVELINLTSILINNSAEIKVCIKINYLNLQIC